MVTQISTKIILILTVLSGLFYSCTPLTPTSGPAATRKTLRLEDVTYEKEIKTVRLYQNGAPQSPAATQLRQSNLLLEFDDLTTERDTYNARIVHCNYNWTQSSLQDLDFITSFNEFPLNNAEFSVDTHLPYVHYWLNVPAVKLPGNYVLVVYRGSDREDIVLSRRFMVYDMRISFRKDPKLVGSGSIAEESQQINFTINHANVEILNPMQDVHVNIRQNQRWDNMLNDVRPTFVRDIEKELEYRFFDEAKMFRGGNEFRFFDLRSLINPGRNVNYVDRKVKPFEAFIAMDKPRTHEAYSQYEEMNGTYLIDNYDFRDRAYTNYAYINFSLQTKPVNGDVYVIGSFNSWNLDRQNKMTYDTASSQYKARILMKQGLYDYQYYVRSTSLPSDHLEGSHFQTENMYEVFVYYRGFQPAADLLIGYISFDENQRRR